VTGRGLRGHREGKRQEQTDHDRCRVHECFVPLFSQRGRRASSRRISQNIGSLRRRSDSKKEKDCAKCGGPPQTCDYSAQSRRTGRTLAKFATPEFGRGGRKRSREGELGRRLQSKNGATYVPPCIVTSATKTPMSTFSLRKWAEPSTSSTCTPPGWKL
jgi:hypothetical protein